MKARAGAVKGARKVWRTGEEGEGAPRDARRGELHRAWPTGPNRPTGSSGARNGVRTSTGPNGGWRADPADDSAAFALLRPLRRCGDRRYPRQPPGEGRRRRAPRRDACERASHRPGPPPTPGGSTGPPTPLFPATRPGPVPGRTPRRPRTPLPGSRVSGVHPSFAVRRVPSPNRRSQVPRGREDCGKDCGAGAGRAAGPAQGIGRRRRRAFATTEIEDRAMAAAATSGERRAPVAG